MKRRAATKLTPQPQAEVKENGKGKKRKEEKIDVTPQRVKKAVTIMEVERRLSSNDERPRRSLRGQNALPIPQSLRAQLTNLSHNSVPSTSYPSAASSSSSSSSSSSHPNSPSTIKKSTTSSSDSDPPSSSCSSSSSNYTLSRPLTIRKSPRILSNQNFSSPNPSLFSSLGFSSLASSSSSGPSFFTCLNAGDDISSPTDSPRMMTSVLRRALSIQELEDTSWLSSSLIDLVISKFAKFYRNVCFMSIDFVVLALTSLSRTELEQATDIIGNKVNYKDTRKSIVFICNAQNIHWNLIRVVRYPEPELQLFEPMGKPSNRHGGLSYRQVPRVVIDWLELCCPLSNGASWLSAGISAITRQQQFTAFDCGVACLLYAEKCGQGQRREDINDYTTQENITDYRKILQAFTKRISREDSQ